MLIPIKHDPSIPVSGSAIKRGASAAHSLKMQRFYLRLCRATLDPFYLRLWHQERTYWAHLLGRTV